nr:uncharacterized protein LOC115262584 [Aedes albopictus]
MYRFVTVLVIVSVVQALSVDDRTVDVNINVEKNSNTYFQSKLNEGSFQYGLDVEETLDNHFQHKVKGPDGVTYGCYGFVDPDGKPHLTHYVSDIKGYRVVPPDSATKIYVDRLEKSINKVYQASQEKSVQWKDLFFPPACRTLYGELLKKAAATQRPTTARPTTPRATTPRATTPRPTTPRPTTARPTIPAPVQFEPEFGGSNVHESFLPHETAPAPAACSQVCNDLKGELQEIKLKLKSLIDSLARKDAEESKRKSGDNGTYAYFPVMLSNNLPEGVAFGQGLQCGRQ